MLAKWKSILLNPHKYGFLKNDRHFKMKVWGKKDSPAEVLKFWLCQFDDMCEHYSMSCHIVHEWLHGISVVQLKSGNPLKNISLK